MNRVIRYGLIILIGGLCAGCGVGVGEDTGDLDNDLGVNVAAFVVVDLAHRTYETRSAISDLTDNDAYRDQYLVFRAVSSGSVRMGQEPGTYGQQEDEVREDVALDRYYLAVFELTQAQWTRLAGTAPWEEVPGSIVAQVVGADYPPAFGLSVEVIDSTFAAAGISGVSLDLPSDAQWERAAKAGDDDALFAWGTPAATRTTIANHAILLDTTSGAAGPRTVGQRAPNDYGFYDMHGNVWELTSQGHVRGGSWADALPQARAANKNDLDSDTPHPLVGLRPILRIDG